MIVRAGSTSRDLGREIKAHWEAGKLDIKGAVVDARDGSNTPQTKTEVRGDYIGWFDGAASEGWAQGRDRKDYVSLPVSPHDHCRAAFPAAFPPMMQDRPRDSAETCATFPPISGPIVPAGVHQEDQHAG